MCRNTVLLVTLPLLSTALYVFSCPVNCCCFCVSFHSILCILLTWQTPSWIHLCKQRMINGWYEFVCISNHMRVWVRFVNGQDRESPRYAAVQVGVSDFSSQLTVKPWKPHSWIFPFSHSFSSSLSHYWGVLSWETVSCGIPHDTWLHILWQQKLLHRHS